MQHPDATLAEKVLAGGYIGVQAVAHGAVVVGTGVAAAGCLTGAGTVICTGAGSAVTTASADGNPINEITAVGNAVTKVAAAANADGNPINEIQAIQTGSHAVYQYVQNGVTRYVGHTNNFSRRAAKHFRGRGWTIEPIQGLDRLSKSDARAVEQVLIELNGLPNLSNQINSISIRNPLYREAIQRGMDILRQTGNIPQ